MQHNDLRQRSWQPGDTCRVGLPPEEGDGPLYVIPGGAHPAQLLTVLHEVTHIAV